jgi:hypothetical protein
MQMPILSSTAIQPLLLSPYMGVKCKGKINWFLIHIYLCTVLVFDYMPIFIHYFKVKTPHFLKEEDCSKVLGLQN